MILGNKLKINQARMGVDVPNQIQRYFYVIFIFDILKKEIINQDYAQYVLG